MVTKGPSNSVWSWFSLRGHPISNCNSNSNWLKPSVAPGYIIVWHPPASCGRTYLHRIQPRPKVKVIFRYLWPDAPVSAVPLLIYTGASLNWRLGRGSICYNPVVYSYADACINTTTQWRWRVAQSLEKYTSHFIWKAVCERELEIKQNCNILTPTLMANSVVSFSFSRVAQPEARGPAFCWVLAFSTTSCLQTFWSPNCSRGPLLPGAGFLYHILSPTDWIFCAPSYIIVQLPTQYLPITGHRNVSLPPSLEWHVWSSSSGNSCHAVHRSLSSGASVYDCTVGF